MGYGSLPLGLNKMHSEILSASKIVAQINADIATATQGCLDSAAVIARVDRDIAQVNFDIAAAAAQIPDVSSIYTESVAQVRAFNQSLADIAGIPSKVAEQVNQFHRIAREAASISDIAKVIQSFDIDSYREAVQETLDRLPDPSKIAELEREFGKHKIRDAAYLEWKEEGFASEQREVESKLSPNFDDLTTNEKLDQILSLAKENQSSKLMIYLAGIATNLISDAIGIVYKNWLCIFVVVVMFLEFTKPKQRLQKIRGALQNFADQQTRIVTHACIGYRNPKRNSEVIVRLQVGWPVHVSDKLRGWQQIYITIGNRKVFAWVRSKYLSRAK